MSPMVLPVILSAISFPRVSGDEPVLPFSSPASELFSPRERG